MTLFAAVAAESGRCDYSSRIAVMGSMAIFEARGTLLERDIKDRFWVFHKFK